GLRRRAAVPRVIGGVRQFQMSRMCGSTFLPNSSSASISSSGCSEPRGLERQIDDAGADLFAALLQLREDLVRPAAEVDRQRPVDIRQPPPLAGDVALVELQKRG